MRYLSLIIIVFSLSVNAQNSGPIPNIISDGDAFVPPNCVPFPFVPDQSTTVIQQTASLPEGNVSDIDTIPVSIRAWRIACPGGGTIIAMDFENLSGVQNVSPVITNLTVSTGFSNAFASLSFTSSTSSTFAVPNEDIGRFWFLRGNVSPPMVVTRDVLRDFTGQVPPPPALHFLIYRNLWYLGLQTKSFPLI